MKYKKSSLIAFGLLAFLSISLIVWNEFQVKRLLLTMPSERQESVRDYFAHIRNLQVDDFVTIFNVNTRRIETFRVSENKGHQGLLLVNDKEGSNKKSLYLQVSLESTIRLAVEHDMSFSHRRDPGYQKNAETYWTQ